MLNCCCAVLSLINPIPYKRKQVPKAANDAEKRLPWCDDEKKNSVNANTVITEPYYYVLY